MLVRPLLALSLAACISPPPVAVGERCGGFTPTPASCVKGAVCCDLTPNLTDDPGVCFEEAEGCPEDTAGVN